MTNLGKGPSDRKSPADRQGGIGSRSPGKQGKAEEEGHTGAMVDDDDAAMRRREDGEPALPIRWASKRRSLAPAPPANRASVPP